LITLSEHRKSLYHLWIGNRTSTREVRDMEKHIIAVRSSGERGAELAEELEIFIFE